MEFWSKLNEKLNDDNILNIIVSIVVGLTPFAIFIIWGGFLKNFDLEKVSYTDIGFFTVLTVYTTISTRLNFRKIGKMHETSQNKDVSETEEKISEITFSVSDDLYTNKYIDLLNTRTQKNADKIYTNKIIERLRRKQSKLFSKGKDTSEINERISLLEQSPVKAPSVSLFALNHITSKSIVEKSNYSVVDSKVMTDNPITVGIGKSFFMSVAKGIMIGGIAIGWSWGLGADVTIAYLLALISTTISTASLQYILSRFYTKGKYLTSIRERLAIKQEALKYVEDCKAKANELTEEEKLAEQERLQKEKQEQEETEEKQRQREIEDLERERKHELEKARIQAEIERAKNQPTEIIREVEKK